MKGFGLFIAAAAGLLLLSGTLTAGPESAPDGSATAVPLAETRQLPAWHPPVPGWRSQERRASPSLPDGHPPLPDHLVCPVTGAIGKPDGHAKQAPAPLEGLYRI